MEVGKEEHRLTPLGSTKLSNALRATQTIFTGPVAPHVQEEAQLGMDKIRKKGYWICL
jgi:hypothetical protein